MVNDRWKIMNTVSELEDGQQHKPQRMSCGYLLCTILLFVAVLLAITVTGTILFMNHYHAAVTEGRPLISTNKDENTALVTVEKVDGSRINIFIDPNCPDYNSNFLRLEGVQTSLLHSLTDHDSDLKSVKGQDRALLARLAEEVSKLSAYTGQLKMDYEALRRGQGTLGQELSTLQTEQGRLIQLLSESQINMVKVVNSVSDALNSMQKEQGGIKTRLKADLQKAPARGARPRGCANGSRPRDCSEIYTSGQREDGIYSVFPTHYPSGFQVFCDMSTDGGGWTCLSSAELFGCQTAFPARLLGFSGRMLFMSAEPPTGIQRLVWRSTSAVPRNARSLHLFRQGDDPRCLILNSMRQLCVWRWHFTPVYTDLLLRCKESILFPGKAWGPFKK